MSAVSPVLECEQPVEPEGDREQFFGCRADFLVAHGVDAGAVDALTLSLSVSLV